MTDNPGTDAPHDSETGRQLDTQKLIDSLIGTVEQIQCPFEPSNLEEYLDRRIEFSQALIAKGRTAVETLLDALKANDEAWAKRQGKASRSSWYAYELSVYERVREIILHILGAIGDAKAIEYARQIMVDEEADNSSRRAAALALERIGTSGMSDMVTQWRIDRNIDDKLWLQDKLILLLLIGDTDAKLRARIAQMAQQKNMDQKQVVINLLGHLNPHSHLLFRSGINLPEFTEDELAYLFDEDAEVVAAENAKTQLIQQLVRQLVQSDQQAALNALNELQTRGWLEDGSLHGINPHFLLITDPSELAEVVSLSIVLPGANFARADLVRFLLADAQLQQANFMRANLKHANFSSADLRGADFTGADLTGARLVNAKLQSANFTSAVLVQADLSDANLEAADLTEANLMEANLRDVSYNEHTILPDGTNWTPKTDVEHFTKSDHPNFWRSVDSPPPAS